MDSYRMIDKKDVGGFLSAIISITKRTFLYVLASSKRYYLLAVLVFTGIVLGGYLLLKSTNYDYYEANMACEFNSLGNKTYGEMLQNIAILVKTHSFVTLSQTLEIPMAQAQKISSMYSTNYSGSPLYEDITADKYPFYIYVKATDRSVFSVLEPAIIKYLNTSSPFHQKTMEFESASTLGKIKFLERDISLADTIILDYGKYLTNGRPLVISDTSAKNSNISSLFRYKDLQENKLLQLQWRTKELNQTVEVLHGFLPPDNPIHSNDGLIKYLLISGACISIFIVVCANLIKDGSVR
jgi:hypothetical protein